MAGAAEALGAALAAVLPRVRVEPGLAWADGRGLSSSRWAPELIERLEAAGFGEARIGVATTAVAAFAATVRRNPPGKRTGPLAPAASPTPPLSHSGMGRGGLVVIPPGQDREFLAPLPLSLLSDDLFLRGLLEGVGIGTCGALAALPREAVEVRLGAEGAALWRLARADDPRRLFGGAPATRPEASLEFVDYVITDPERLIFTANALLGQVCDALRARGEHARRLVLTLSLANGEAWARTLRPARPTASRATWLRLARGVLERLTVPDAVAGIRLDVQATESAAVRQGDLFDTGFATLEAVEAALGRLLESQDEVLVAPEVGGHPLAERRNGFRALGLSEWESGRVVEWATIPGGDAHRADPPAPWVPTAAAAKAAAAGRTRAAPATSPRPESGRTRVAPATSPRPESGRARWRSPHPPLSHSPTPGRGVGGKDPSGGVGRGVGKGLTLQLLPEPVRVAAETEARRDHVVPVRFRDRTGWQALVTVAGPDRVSGGQWEDGYAREYYRGVTADGVLVWLYHDAREDAWYLHGWWD